eukprot:CAMPEP_0113696458 /NCGR_PEP_ID=MMETSP0038_2-20120614/21505_1 /TAXON_ID=2898 /ORGANISM="Cryptomonas paramecium" /LENGTH=377 /DNA_ID=CAMNT_0000619191 /DNA_START=332 /DNA_END=1466 /DNA_ORIENTATION=+ /assembly_acc=CAM_ASM_000170
MSPQEAQAYFLANAIMDGRDAKKAPSVVVPPNAHWVGMVKDNGGKFHYADGTGNVFDKKQEDLVPRKTWVRTKGGLVSINALRKAYKEAGKYLKPANNQILTAKHTGTIASKGAKDDVIKATAHDAVSAVDISREAEGKEALQNAASALSKITTDLKTGKTKDLAAVANKLADVSAHIGASILKKQGASEAAQQTFMKEAENKAPHPEKEKISLNRELRIEMDLHARLFGKGGLCTRGAFQKSAVCRTLSGANWDAAWAKVIQDMAPSEPAFPGRSPPSLSAWVSDGEQGEDSSARVTSFVQASAGAQSSAHTGPAALALLERRGFGAAATTTALGSAAAAWMPIGAALTATPSPPLWMDCGCVVGFRGTPLVRAGP